MAETTTKTPEQLLAEAIGSSQYVWQPTRLDYLRGMLRGWWAEPRFCDDMVHRMNIYRAVVRLAHDLDLTERVLVKKTIITSGRNGELFNILIGVKVQQRDLLDWLSEMLWRWQDHFDQVPTSGQAEEVWWEVSALRNGLVAARDACLAQQSQEQSHE